MRATLLCWLLLTAAACAAPAQPVTIVADHSRGAATVLVRRSDAAASDAEKAWIQVADTVPAQVELRYARYDVQVESHPSFFQLAHGVLNDFAVSSLNAEMDVRQDVSVDWLRVLLVALPIVVVLLAVLLLLKRRPIVMETTVQVPSPLVSLEQPVSLGPYKILRRIARGGMGAVYEAEDSYGDHYAIKVPAFDLFENVEFKTRFMREIEIGKSLHHPNIVRIFDYSINPPYIAMELVRGVSLKDVIEVEAPMTPAAVLRYVLPILDALGYGHARQVIHRDVKPSNIIVDASGAVKVADYGIARALTMETLTASGIALGTPQYMAPEQTTSRDVDARVDLYSVGVIIYQMLADRLPYDEPDMVALMCKKSLNSPPSMRYWRTDIDEQLDALILRVLDPDPVHRPQTAAAFAEALQAIPGLLTERQ